MEIMHCSWSVLILPMAACLYCWRQIHHARWAPGLKKPGYFHGVLIEKLVLLLEHGSGAVRALVASISLR